MERRVEKLLFHGYTVSAGMMKKFWRWIVVIVAQQCECTKCHCTLHLKMVKVVNFMLCISYHKTNLLRKARPWDFPGGPVVKSPRFLCRGPGLDPWSGN